MAVGAVDLDELTETREIRQQIAHTLVCRLVGDVSYKFIHGLNQRSARLMAPGPRPFMHKIVLYANTELRVLLADSPTTTETRGRMGMLVVALAGRLTMA